MKPLSLDLVAFLPKSFEGDVISFIEQIRLGIGMVSHVGILIGNDILPELPSDRWYVWESTVGEVVPDVFSQKIRDGPQVRDLGLVLVQEQRRAMWCPLKKNPFRQEDISMKSKHAVILKVRSIFEQTRNYRYASLIQLGAAVFQLFRPFRRLLEHYNFLKKRVFCSELVAIVYREIGILDSDIDPENVTPVDFFRWDIQGLPLIVSQLTPIIGSFHERSESERYLVTST